MPGPRQLLNAGGDHGDAVLVRLDLLRNADDHRSLGNWAVEREAGIVGTGWRGNQGEVRLASSRVYPGRPCEGRKSAGITPAARIEVKPASASSAASPQVPWDPRSAS